MVAKTPWRSRRMLTAQNPTTMPPDGDYNLDDTVDAADYTLWRDSLASTTDLRADGDASGTIDAADYNIWKMHFGESTSGSGSGMATAVPEPTALILLLLSLAAPTYVMCSRTVR